LIVRLVAAAMLLVAGCGSNGESEGSADSRIEKCTQRFLTRTESETAEVRRYVETTYCAAFDRRGWIHDDGTLSIAAYTDSGSEACGRAELGGTPKTVPCDEVEGAQSPEVLDCALLDLVRKDEVTEYLEDLQRTREVRCDDETPLDDLGAR
jgi:hypothetical protein